MKFLSLIGALYILALTVLPCSDLEHESNSDVSVTEQQDDHDHGSEPDGCSPLCFCQCCHIHVTFFSTSYQFNNIEPFVDNYSSYISFEPETPVLRLLRPPRV